MIRISPDSPPKSKIQDANKKMIRKMTALFKNRTMVQTSSLGPNKHKRGRLCYIGVNITDYAGARLLTRVPNI